MARLLLRITPSFASILGAGDYNWFVIEKEIKRGDTIGGLLTDVVREKPDFGKVIFDSKTGNISDQILVTLNNDLLQGNDIRQVKLDDGDVVTITPVYEGG